MPLGRVTIQAKVNSLVNSVVDGHMIPEIMNITPFINLKMRP